MISPKYMILTALICISSSGVKADEPNLSREFSQCMDNSESVTVEMIDCIFAETKRQDARLNKGCTK